MKIAFIGLGIMGSRMAANILNGGHNLSVHNRTKIKAEFLLKNGAIWADTPEEVAKEANVIITMLENPDVVEDLALGKNGFLPALKEGSLWIDCSTVNPSFSKRMGKEAEKHGIRFLDAPVSGSKEPAAKAALIFLVGGQADDLGEVVISSGYFKLYIIQISRQQTGFVCCLVAYQWFYMSPLIC